MATKKAPSKAQLAARKKFVEMVRAKSKAKKTATKKAPVKKVSGLDKVVRKGNKTDVKYTRVSGANLANIRYSIDIHTDNDSLTRYTANTLISAKKIAKSFGISNAANTYSKELKNNNNVSVMIYDTKLNQNVYGYSLFFDKKGIIKYKIYNLK